MLAINGNGPIPSRGSKNFEMFARRFGSWEHRRNGIAGVNHEEDVGRGLLHESFENRQIDYDFGMMGMKGGAPLV